MSRPLEKLTRSAVSDGSPLNRHNSVPMKIGVNSDEFRAWHEVGHATACLCLGGDIDGIEFLEGDSRGFAVAHCSEIMPEMERSVACGGFAIEFYLLEAGYVEYFDLQEISNIVFSNAWRDRLDFAGRIVTEDNDFTREENEEFMNYATQVVAPIFKQYFPRMQIVVDELLANRKIDGSRVKQLLQIEKSR